VVCEVAISEYADVLIVNADDWGRTPLETDAALRCFREGRISSVSAMVFMSDSERASSLAREHGIDAGLHLNFDTPLEGQAIDERLHNSHAKTLRYLASGRYAPLVYNPFLGEQFRYVYRSQVEEFMRLYGRHPSHVNGHHHLHLCANMLFAPIFSRGTAIRLTFHFERGEKNFVNRIYRRILNEWLKHRYTTTDRFYSLSQALDSNRLVQIAQLAKRALIELNTHPFQERESKYLLSEEYSEVFGHLDIGTYSSLAGYRASGCPPG